MNDLPPLIAYLNTGGVLGLFLLIGWAFYTEKLRFGRDFNDLEKKLDDCEVQIKELWAQKVADKEEKAELARAYLRIREHDKS